MGSQQNSPAVKHRLREWQLCAQAPGVALLRIAGCKGAAGQSREMGRNASCSQCSERQTWFLLFWSWWVRCSKQTQILNSPPAPSLWRICQEIAFSPLAEEPLEEFTVRLKWLGGVEHLSIPVLDWKQDSRSRSEHTLATHTGMSCCLHYLWVGRCSMVDI